MSNVLDLKPTDDDRDGCLSDWQLRHKDMQDMFAECIREGE